MSQAKEAQIKLYKTREDKELDKVIALENKVKVLNDIVYKTGQSVQTMNMLNRNCKTSFAKPEFLKKAQRANPRLYDIGVISTTSVSRPQLKSNQLEDRVMPNNSQGKKQNVEDHHRNFKFSNNKTSVTACNDSLNAKTSNVNLLSSRRESILSSSTPGAQSSRDRNLKTLTKFCGEISGTVKFGNEQNCHLILAMEICSRNDYYSKGLLRSKGLNHNLFFVGQSVNCGFWKFALWKTTCYNP
ncbi:hypothetical protein Tco_1218727 [Tanacetum coccineum]